MKMLNLRQKTPPRAGVTYEDRPKIEEICLDVHLALSFVEAEDFADEGV